MHNTKKSVVQKGYWEKAGLILGPRPGSYFYLNILIFSKHDMTEYTICIYIYQKDIKT